MMCVVIKKKIILTLIAIFNYYYCFCKNYNITLTIKFILITFRIGYLNTLFKMGIQFEAI